jgi:hypothetical protein
MAITEPSQKPPSAGLAILISCHALAQNIRRTSSDSLAMFTAITGPQVTPSYLALCRSQFRVRLTESDRPRL